MKNSSLKQYAKEILDATGKVLINHASTILILLIYATIFSLISFVNHYNFRTGAYDLGIYSNAIYDYSRFQWNDNPVMHRLFDNILSDHFSLILFFISPFRYIFDSYTLLVFQIVAILFGGIGTYKMVLHLSKKVWYARLAMIHFFSTWAIYSALAFHYHNSVVGAMFVPWIFYFFAQKKWKLTAIFTILTWICKETMPLWLVFVFLGLLLLYFKEKEMRKAAVVGMAGSLVYSMLVFGVVMPALSEGSKSYTYFKYQVLGETPGEAFTTMFTEPKYVFSLLFENHGKSIFDSIKTELHYIVLVSGGIALIYRPQFLIMLLPIYATKLFHNSYVKWGLNHHYNIEFTAILTIAFFFWVINSKTRPKYKTLFLILGTVVCMYSTYTVIEHRKSKWYTPLKTRFYKPAMYKQKFDVEKVYQFMDSIPDDAKVCAQSILVPHLAMRERIYTYPHIRDAEYIVLLPASRNKWPLKKDKYKKKLEELKADSLYKISIDKKEFLLFKRKDIE